MRAGFPKAWPLPLDQLSGFNFAAILSLVLFRWQDLRPLYAGRCQYYSKSTTPPEVSERWAVLSLWKGWLRGAGGGTCGQAVLGGPWGDERSWGGNRVLGGLGELIPPCLVRPHW